MSRWLWGGITLGLVGCRQAAQTPLEDACSAEYQLDNVGGEDQRTIGTMLPDETGAFGVHVRLAWPEQATSERWPMALEVQGAWEQKMGTDARLQVAAGVVEVRVDLPGGGLSTGDNDLRGAASRATLATVLRWMAGELRDQGGCTAPERTGHGDPDDLYLIGTSNGGNLAVAALADPALDLPPIAGLITWETPVSPPFVNVEYGADPTVYVPGSCALAPDLRCPFPMEQFLDLHKDAPLDVLCFDLNADRACDKGIDVVVVGAEDPETDLQMLSPALTAEAEALGAELAGFAGSEAATAWWAVRDASAQAGALVAAWPDLPVVLLGSDEDHVQSASDHPQIYGWGEALQASGAAWTRLNPGTRWLSIAGGENPPNAVLSLGGTTLRLLTEEEEVQLEDVLAASVLELSERTRTGDWTTP